MAVEAGDGEEVEVGVTDAPTAVERVRATYDEVHGRLWRAVLAWSGSPDVADEAVAEAFAQLLGRRDEVRDPAAWVWRSAFRIAAGDLNRRRADAAATSDGDASGVAVSDRLPDDAIDLVEALAQLSEQQRQCVALVYIADQSAAEAARVLGTSSTAVRVQLLRARRRLKAILPDPEEEP